MGTWVYDGGWSMDPGSEKSLSWWQGPNDRIEARMGAREGAYAHLTWWHGDEATRLPGRYPGEEAGSGKGIRGTLIKPLG